MRIARWSAVLAVMVVLGTACASSSSTVGSGSGSATPTEASSTSGGGSGGYGGGGYGSGGGGGGGGGGGASAMTVTQANYQFSPSTFSVASGDTITVTNSTPGTPHTFTVTGQAIDVTVSPASSQDVKIDLPAGTYPFICRFHQASGMKGTLTVT
jgi:plastocyanin